MNLAKIIINISGKVEADADCQYPIVRTVAKELKWKSQVDPQRTDWDVWWTDNAILPETLFRMLPHQKINHFPGEDELMQACISLQGRICWARGS